MNRQLFLQASVALFVAIIPALLSQAQSDPEPPVATSRADDSPLAIEERYDALLTSANLQTWMQEMTPRPHHVGSPKAKQNAEFIAGLFREWGYETEIEVFHVLFPTPKTRQLFMVRPQLRRAALEEKIVATDSAAEALKSEALPPYNAYSADGDVTGTLVYVNQGLPHDYEVLDERGIDVKGKIVIARYGGSWRGIKVKVAAEKGAIGCILYNDPLEDGYARGGAYPAGAYKHNTAVQRGSVIDLPVRPGDPLTPGYGATKDAERLERADAETLMNIPVLPISSVDAEPLLKTLDGPVAPADWRGALPLTYRLGGGKTVVRLHVEFDWNLVPTYNVIARMKGSTYPDQWVLRGNHHDAWVIGARDPMSGLVPLLEQARAFAELARTGWQPKRSLVFCAWDGEEQGMLGSTEWAEHHADELREKAVAYINSDTNARGILRIRGSHSMESLAADVAHQVFDPQTGDSISERMRSQKLVYGSDDEKKDYLERSNVRIDPLGAGSDYTAFIDHLGIAAYDIGFNGEGVGGEYHTCFDTYDHFSRYIDPEHDYGVTLAQVCGRIALRLADADILPFDFNAQAETLNGYIAEVVKLTDKERAQTELNNRLIAENRYKIAADPTLTYIQPEAKPPVPQLGFAPLLSAGKELNTVAAKFHQTLEATAMDQLPTDTLANLNQLIYQSERTLISEQGLPRRPWYRHQIYAPGYYTGYGAKTLPGVREAIEQHQWQEAEEQIQQTAAALQRLTKQLTAAEKLLSE